MQDKNGKQIEAGMVVEVSGAWAKADNGKFMVESVYNDSIWIKKLGAKGQLLKDCGRSWPYVCGSYDWKVCKKIDAHNRENAKIEVLGAWIEPEKKPVSNEIRITATGIYKGENYCSCYYRYDEKSGEVEINARNYGHVIPREMGNVRNDTDAMTDYFDKDSLTLRPGDKWYDQVKVAAIKGIIHDLKRNIAWLKRDLEKPGSATHRQLGMDKLCEYEKQLAKLTA